MEKTTVFSGFSKDTIKFFDGLQKNNNRHWFEEHRGMYENSVLEPSKAFVKAMGARLRTIAPKIIAVPKVNKSLFRISRDARFSLNKSPYKTFLGIYFWEGMRQRMECSGFYFHLEPPKMILGVGVYVFSDRLLHQYRRAVIDTKMGKEIAKVIEQITRIKEGILGGQHYKRIPAGFDPSHPNARLLLHNGLHFGQEMDIPKELFSSQLVEYCFERYAPCASLHRWLVKVLS